MKEKTAVEWLVEQICTSDMANLIFQKEINLSLSVTRNFNTDKSKLLYHNLRFLFNNNFWFAFIQYYGSCDANGFCI